MEKRKTYQIDANGKILGRLASEIAVLLQGKNRSDYKPNIDCGHFVEVKNVDKLKFSGKKENSKIYYHFSGYPSGLKQKKLQDLFKQKPQKVLEIAVRRMLPKNRLLKERIKRLKFI